MLHKIQVHNFNGMEHGHPDNARSHICELSNSFPGRIFHSRYYRKDSTENLVTLDSIKYVRKISCARWCGTRPPNAKISEIESHPLALFKTAISAPTFVVCGVIRSLTIHVSDSGDTRSTLLNGRTFRGRDRQIVEVPSLPLGNMNIGSSANSKYLHKCVQGRIFLNMGIFLQHILHRMLEPARLNFFDRPIMPTESLVNRFRRSAIRKPKSKRSRGCRVPPTRLRSARELLYAYMRPSITAINLFNFQ